MKSLSEGVSPQRSIRVPDSEWNLLKALLKYTEDGTASEIIRNSIREYTVDYAHFVVDEGGDTTYECGICSLDTDPVPFEEAVWCHEEWGGICSHCANGIGRL